MTKIVEKNNAELTGTENNEEVVVETANVETNVETSEKAEVEGMKETKFVVVDELAELGYTESGVRSQKTTLLKKVMETELASEVKDIEEIEREDFIKLLTIVMSRKTGRVELKENAKARLVELGADIEKLVEKTKIAKKKAPNCKDLFTMIKTLQEEVAELKNKLAK